MRDRTLELKVGLLIVTALAIFAGFVLVLGNFSLRSGMSFQVDYEFSGNIQEGAPVKVSGIKVGKVEEVAFLGGQLDQATGRRVQVRLTVWVEDRVRDSLRVDSEYFINTAGVLGEQYLEIVPGKDWQAPPIAPGTVVRGVDPPRTDLIVARLYTVLDQLSRVLVEDKDFIDKLLRNSASAVAELDGILRDNREEIGSLVRSADAFAGEAATTLKKVNAGLGDGAIVGRTLRDADQLLVTANRSLDSLTPPAERALTDVRRVTGLVTDERIDRVIKVADGAVGATGKATQVLDEAHGMVKDLRAGKGTAGALLAREEIYADLREMIRDLKRNPWKFFWKE
jgi:phospholipid/cholesterol/gamma-HCH transport system substrate-binding protein